MRTPNHRSHIDFLCLILLLLLLPTNTLAHDSDPSQIASLTKAIANSPNSVELYLRRGELYQRLRHWNEAMRDFRRAEEIDPRNSTLRMSLASLFIDTNRPAAALEQLEDDFTLEAHAEFWFLRSRAHTDLEHWDDAIVSLDRALTLSESPRPNHYFERVRLVLARDPLDLSTAIEGLDAGLERLGPIPSLGLHAIELEIEAGAFDDALSRLDTMAGWLGRPELVLARRGEILDAAGRQLEAQTAYTEALQQIESLSPRRRNNAATRELEQRLRESLSAIEHPVLDESK